MGWWRRLPIFEAALYGWKLLCCRVLNNLFAVKGSTDQIDFYSQFREPFELKKAHFIRGR
jgi:hypothetical protein